MRTRDILRMLGITLGITSVLLLGSAFTNLTNVEAKAIGDKKVEVIKKP